MKSITLKVWGQASQRTVAEMIVSLTPDHTQQTLMDLLRSRGIPIASSCQGAGICRKCIVNDQLLSCQITLAQMLEQQGNTNPAELLITVSYL